MQSERTIEQRVCNAVVSKRMSSRCYDGNCAASLSCLAAKSCCSLANPRSHESYSSLLGAAKIISSLNATILNTFSREYFYPWLNISIYFLRDRLDERVKNGEEIARTLVGVGVVEKTNVCEDAEHIGPSTEY